MSSVVSSLLLDIQGNVASLRQSLDEGKSQLSNFKESALKIGEAMGIAFGVEKIIELGKQFGEFALKVGETKEAVEALDINGSADKATASVLALSQTYGVDLKNALDSINKNSQAFGDTFDDSSKRVEQGLALSTGHAQEFLAIVQGYSRSFAAAGVSADQFSAIAVQAVQKGFGDEAFAGLQKGIKQIELMSPIAEKALKAVGLNAQQVANEIANGTATPLSVIQQMGDALKNLPSDSQRAAEAMNLFGKSSTQLAGFVQFLAEAKTNMNDLVANATEGQKAMLHLNESTKELDEVWSQLFGNSSGYWTELKANFIDAFTTGLKAIVGYVIDIINDWIDLYNQSLTFRLLVQGLVLDFKILWDSIKALANIAGDVFSYIGRLIKDVLTGNISDIPKAFAKSFQDIGKDAVQWGKNVYNQFYDGVKTAVEAKPVQHLLGLSDTDEGQTKGRASGIFDGGNDIGHEAKGKSKTKNVSPNLQVKTNIDVSKDFDKIKRSIDGASKSAYYFPTTLEKIGEAFNKNIQGTGVSAMEKLGQSIGDSAAKGTLSLQSLGNATLDYAKQTIASSLAASLAETILDSQDLPYPANLIAAALSVGVVSALFSSIPSFATGTENFGGGWAKINEGGIGNGEAVFLPGGSTVLPARDTANLLSNSSSNTPKVQVVVTGKISGRDILLSQNETNRVINNSR